MTTTNINLKHGDIKIAVDIEGVEPAKARSTMEQAFNLFINEVMKINTIEQAYMETYALRSNQEEPKSNIITSDEEEVIENNQVVDDKNEEVAESKEEEKEGATENNQNQQKSMEELLKDVDPRNYRKFGEDNYRFQVYYICEKCGHKGKAFVERKPTFKCRECGKIMKLIPATDRPFPFHDEHGNFYVAGKYRRSVDHQREVEKIYQFKLEEEMDKGSDSDKPKKLQEK